MSGAETLLEELERRQDQVLVDLDLLDARIVAVLESWLGPSELKKMNARKSAVVAADEQDDSAE